MVNVVYILEPTLSFSHHCSQMCLYVQRVPVQYYDQLLHTISLYSVSCQMSYRLQTIQSILHISRGPDLLRPVLAWARCARHYTSTRDGDSYPSLGTWTLSSTVLYSSSQYRTID